MLSPLDSPDGMLVTAAIRDISIRKAAEEELARTERRYRGLLEAAPDAMIVVDELGEIMLLNVQAEKQFGYTRDELIGQRVTNIIPEGFAERLIADGLRSTRSIGSAHGTGIELVACARMGASSRSKSCSARSTARKAHSSPPRSATSASARRPTN